MNGIVAAFGATGLYYVGFAIFKLAADRMAPLRGNRIPHMAWAILTDWVFLAGLVLVLGGLGLQIVALGHLALGVAVPIFMSGTIPLLLIAMAFFGDRLTAREWLSVLLIGGAILLLTASVGDPPPIKSVDVPVWKLAVVVAPAVVVPLMIMALGDRRPDGRHARAVTGIAYGLSSGFPVGTAELAIKGWSDSGGMTSDILSTPYPYVTVLTAGLGFGIMVAAFQRCRVSIVATVMTVSAKSYLLLGGTFLYGEPWPQETSLGAMRVGALLLGAVAVLQFPRHRPVLDSGEPPAEEVPPAQDPFGGPALGGGRLGGGSLLGSQSLGGHGFGGAGLGMPGPVLGAPVPDPDMPQAPPPAPPRSPYAHDPQGQGPYGRGPQAGGPYGPEQEPPGRSESGSFESDGPEFGYGRRPPG